MIMGMLWTWTLRRHEFVLRVLMSMHSLTICSMALSSLNVFASSVLFEKILPDCFLEFKSRHAVSGEYV